MMRMMMRIEHVKQIWIVILRMMRVEWEYVVEDDEEMCAVDEEWNDGGVDRVHLKRTRMGKA